MANGLKTALLLGLLSGLLLWIGDLAGGANGLVIAFVFAAIMNFVSYWSVSYTHLTLPTILLV